MITRRSAVALCAAFVVLLLEGCASFQPVNYRPRYANYSLLSGEPLCSAAIGATSVANPSLNTLSMRGATFTSPIGGSFAAFVGSALEEELSYARLYADSAPRVIDITLTENRVDPAIGTGVGRIAATFVVRPASGAALFSKSLSAQRDWPSAFYGMIAVEQARIQHGEMVADLLHQLFADEAFRRSLRCSVS